MVLLSEHYCTSVIFNYLCYRACLLYSDLVFNHPRYDIVLFGTFCFVHFVEFSTCRLSTEELMFMVIIEFVKRLMRGINSPLACVGLVKNSLGPHYNFETDKAQAPNRIHWGLKMSSHRGEVGSPSSCLPPARPLYEIIPKS